MQWLIPRWSLLAENEEKDSRGFGNQEWGTGTGTTASEHTGGMTMEREAVLRRRLVLPAVAATLLGILHHADHVIRGNLVVQRGLPAWWNHSGWPFQPEVTPFTASLAIYVILIGGIFFTLRGKLWAGYWLASSLLLGAVVTLVHFVGGEAETPSVIFQTYGGGIAPVVAGAVLAGIYVVMAILFTQSIQVRRASGHW